LKVARKANIKKAAVHEKADNTGIGQFLRCDAKSVGCIDLPPVFVPVFKLELNPG
jgi:hypothetical protein